MAKILFLDDSYERSVVFKQQHSDDYVAVVTNVGDFIFAMRQPIHFDEIYLDHDLGPGCPDGREAAKFLATLSPDTLPERIHLHTGDREMAREMGKILRDAHIRSTYAPFQTFR